VRKYGGYLILLHAVAVRGVHRAGLTGGGLDLGEGVVILLGSGTMDFLLEDWFGLIDLELSLESFEIVG